MINESYINILIPCGWESIICGMTRESQRRGMWANGRFVKVMYSLTMLGGGGRENSGIEWGGIGDNGGFVESRNDHGAAGVTSR